MTEYISRESALINCPNVAHDAIKVIPSADVVECKRGKWLWQLADNGWADNICSVCGYTINDDIHVHVDYNFCPNCGARMVNDD